MRRPSWFIDELKHAGNEHLDPEYVQGYDRKAMFDPTAELATLRGLGLGPSSTLVDFGAGTGELCLTASHLCRRVVAVEVSTAMLDAIRAKARELNFGLRTVSRIARAALVACSFAMHRKRTNSVRTTSGVT